jgi:hypothetical protein
VKTGSVVEELERQRDNNLTALPHFQSFAGHRARLTAIASAAARPDEPGDRPGGPRLCVLGAGNGYDLDLAALAGVYQQIHLVDIDEQAVARAAQRQPAGVRERITTHPRVDLSGMFEKLERWRKLQLDEQELAAHAASTSQALLQQLGRFDTVLSACVLSQMQLALLNVLSDRHRLFAALSYTLTVTHLHTLANLLAAGGRAILASDIASEELAPLRQLDPAQEYRELLQELLASGRFFQSVDPRLIRVMVSEDPSLQRLLTCRDSLQAWLWHNGPQRVFLVYALELLRSPAEPPKG